MYSPNRGSKRGEVGVRCTGLYLFAYQNPCLYRMDLMYSTPSIVRRILFDSLFKTKNWGTLHGVGIDWSDVRRCIRRESAQPRVIEVKQSKKGKKQTPKKEVFSTKRTAMTGMAVPLFARRVRRISQSKFLPRASSTLCTIAIVAIADRNNTEQVDRLRSELSWKLCTSHYYESHYSRWIERLDRIILSIQKSFGK